MVLDTRPVIEVTPEIHLMAAQAAAALAAGKVDVYRRGAELVTVQRADGADRGKRALDAPIVRSLTMAGARGLISKVSRWQAWQPGKRGAPPEPYFTRPDEHALAYLLDVGGTWSAIPRLDGVIESPTFQPSGEVSEEPGFDEATGFLFAPNDTFIPVADAPTQEDARAALVELLEPFSDFPHAGEAERGEALCGPARAAAVAAVLTLLAVPAIDGSLPAFLFDASMQRSGKSLQTDVIALIATGRKAPRQTWPVEDEEAEKTLSGYALAGDSLVCFDNIARTFGGAKLEACVTAVPGSTVAFRRFGTQDLAKLPWRTVILGSGNNMTLSPDMARRSLVIRIEPDRDDPERRVDFKIRGGADGLRSWVATARPRLVRAALTILRAWHLAGHPSMGIPALGGFEAWQRLVPAALVWAGASDPMPCLGGRLDGDDADPDTAALGTVLDLWPRLEAVAEGLAFGSEPSGRGITVSGAIDALRRGAAAKKDGAPPDGLDDLREALAELSRAGSGRPLDATGVGYAFRRHRRRPLDGRRLVVATADSASRKAKRWTVERVKR